MYFYREFFGLWNELSKYQNEHFSLPIGALANQDANDLDERTLCYLNAFWTHLHLIAFCQGLAMGSTDEERFTGSPIGDFIGFIEIKIEQFDELEGDDKYSTEKTNALQDEVETFWNEKYLNFANACLEFRRQALKRMKFVEEHKEVGRNDSCPCGGGKKFKKCCMVVH